MRTAWRLLMFLGASGAAFAIAAGFSFALAKRMRDDEYPGWEAFVYGLCCYALVGQVWWRWLLRWWLHQAPGDHALYLVFGACASFFFAIFLGEFIALAEPPQTTQRFKALRLLVAAAVMTGTTVMSDLATIHSPLSKNLRARLRLGRAGRPAAASATEPTAGPR
ncbi:MAG: hypothetical protein HY077_03135 [Elusimicrobia bacterium]|nr:hypothetical protein [Elusimicrobiota bacterium]